VESQAKSLNQLQNVYSSLADPMNAFMSGVGSFGASPLGGGVLGGGGLNPITTETILDTPATLQTQWMAQQFEQGQPGTRSLEGLIASKLVAGQDPTLIMTDLRAKLADPAKSGLDPAEAALFQNSLPQMDVFDPTTRQPTGETTIDWNATRKWIEDRAAPYQAEQGQLMGPNITQNAYGQYVALSEKPSPQMEWLQKMGLPDPRAQYGKDFALQSSPELQAMMGEIATTGQAYEAAQSAYKDFLKKNPMAQALVQQRNEMADKRGRQYQNDFADYTRDLQAWARAGGDQGGGGAGAGGPTSVTGAASQMLTPGSAPGALQPGMPSRSLFDAASNLVTAGPVAPLDAIDAAAGGVGNWLGKAANAVTNAVTPGPVSPLPAAGAVAGAATNAITPGPMNPLTSLGILGEAITRRGRGNRPEPPEMQGRSMLEQLLSGVRAQDPFMSGRLFNEMNRKRKRAGEDVLATKAILAPMFGAQRAGRTPFQDAMLQRLQPIFAVGGAG
jgi:hypothetical protein